MRLCEATIGELPGDVGRPTYPRTPASCGIVHVGLGAFARAHLASYTDVALESGNRGWMITGVSMRSPDVAAQLNPQDGLYIIAERSATGTRYRASGSIAGVLVAPEQPQAVVDAISDAATRIVSFTVTEKGYCRAPDGSLDFDCAASGFYPLLARALHERRERGHAGLTLLSCDNLAANGEVLQGLVEQYLEATDRALLPWFASHCSCPSTMVDRIVPATTERDRQVAESALGLRDEALVVTEPFSQWVIEDRFAQGRPSWEAAGATLVSSVRPFETAKLRMLNGAHSLLAYCGLAAGYRYVHEAIADPRLRALTLQLMLEEAAPTIDPAEGQDLVKYADTLIARFENPALEHALAQIAIDGSQKIPQRWLAVLAQRQEAGLESPATMEGLAAWLLHVRGDRRPVDDPLALQLAEAWRAPDRSATIRTILGPDGLVVSSWRPRAGEIAALAARIAR